MTNQAGGAAELVKQEPTGESRELYERLRQGDQRALADLFSRYHERLRRTIAVRLDDRLQGRVDADDVLQEVYLDAADRIGTYIEEHSGSFFVWLRLIAMQTITNVHRRHLNAQMRDARRELSIFSRHHAEPASTSLAIQLLGRLSSPSNAVMRQEVARQLEEAVQAMDPIDCEILTLRHFEQLTNKEISEVLGIQSKAASIRYVRALKRLRAIVSQIPGLGEP